MIVSTYLENGIFGGNYNIDNVPKNRIISDIIYNNEFLIPIWNGSQWIESITQEEIALQKIEINLELNKLQYTELKSTDWYIIRKLDIGTEIPIEIINERNEIRLKYNEQRAI